MARIESLSILAANGGGKDLLAEKYGPVIENIQTGTISGKYKNQELSGDPTSGSIEAKRFVNANVDDYGTARAASAGKKVKASTVTVAIDQDKEIIEEVEEKDTKLYGVDGLMNRRVANHGQRIEKHLEKVFWSTAVTEGTSKNYTYDTNVKDGLMAAVNELETLKNEFVDGIDRDLMGLVVTPALYEKLHDDIDRMNNPNVNTAAGVFNTFHGVDIDRSNDLPDGTDYVLMVKGSVAQPTRYTIQPVEKIELSKAFAFGVFFSYGTKAVAPDLIFAGTITADE